MNDSLDANLVDKYINAQMVELVDTLDSKSGIREGVGVRLPLWASMVSLLIIILSDYMYIIRYSLVEAD